jgi:hypothetical protein
LGWLMLLTVPGGVVAFIIWLGVLLVHRSNWCKRLSTQVS